MGAKRKVRLALDGAVLQAPIWEKNDIFWEGGKCGCPYCSEIRRTKPLVDLIQYGLIDHDLVITIMQCRACDKMFGVKYAIPHDNENDLIEGGVE